MINNILDKVQSSVNKARFSVSSLFDSINGVNRTEGSSTFFTSPIGLVNRNGFKQSPGFTPNDAYVSNSSDNDNDYWYGALLQTHPDYTGNSGWYNYFNSPQFEGLSTSDRFDKSLSFPNFKDDVPDPARFYSTRDNYLLFNDSSTDYFKHGLHILYNKTPLRSDRNSRETWDGYEESPLRLDNVLRDNTGLGGTPYENNDPVVFGFELVIDAISSPLLNGAVEDFIDQFSSISEIAARKYVLADFKEQFIKIFKTNGNIFTDNSITQKKASILSSDYSNTDSQSNIFETGKKAYMSYYLKKVSGLEFLSESNTSSKKKNITDYRNDVLKLTFTEDVSLTMGTLANLYKLLYWSKPNAKYLIPDNLLRFNCNIIISEVRNLNRVRKAMYTGNLEVIKENVSRYIYSLKECQLWFDQPLHENEIDMSGVPKDFENYTVTMDFKFVTSKFERWVPDGTGFGTYVGYNNGAMWKIGNSGSRESQSSSNAGTINDNSVPKFYTIGLNSLKQNGVKTAIPLQSYTYFYQDVINNSTENPSNTGDGIDGPNETSYDRKGNRSKKQENEFEKFKKNSKNAAKTLSKNIENAAKKELKHQIDLRLQLLNITLEKVRNAYNSTTLGNVYQGTQLNVVNNSQFFFDIRNSLTDFAGDAIGGKLGNFIKDVL